MLALIDSLELSREQNLYMAIACMLLSILLFRLYMGYYQASMLRDRKVRQQSHQEELRQQQEVHRQEAPAAPEEPREQDQEEVEETGEPMA